MQGRYERLSIQYISWSGILQLIDKYYTQIIFLENWTFCCHILGSRHCTHTYPETVDPACRLNIPQHWNWHDTVQHGSVRFNLTEDDSATCLFRSCYTYYLSMLHQHRPGFTREVHSTYMFLIYGSDGVKQIFHIIFWLRMRRMERVPGTWTACCRLHLCTWRLMKGSCQLSTFYSSIPIIRWISIFYSVVS